MRLTARRLGNKKALGLSALVLAAGEASRFSGTKQLAKLGGSTMLERVLDALPRRELRETVVVLGHAAEEIAPVLTGRDVVVVVNHEYRKGIASSIRAGLLAVSRESPAVLLVLADQPFVGESLLRRLLGAFRAARGSKIVAAVSAGVTSPPTVFPRKYFPELLRLRGDRGAKSVIERHAGEVSLIAASSRELSDVDTPEDLERARRLLEA